MRLCCVRSIAIVLAAAFGLSEFPGSARANDISVSLDEARLVKMPDRVASVVIGNPMIADIAVQSGGWMVVTGKSYGATNVIALDRSGAILLEKMIEVQGPRDVVVVYRGGERSTYSCAPHCERRLMLGDNNAVFEVTAAQIGARNGLATGAAQSR
jgi:Pilus formation protein N terminal region